VVVTKFIATLGNGASINEYSDDGQNPTFGPVRMSVVRNPFGRIWVIRCGTSSTFAHYSDDNGDTWNLDATLTHPSGANIHVGLALDTDGEPWFCATTGSVLYYTRRTGPGTWAAYTSLATGLSGLGSENKWVSFCVDINKRFHVMVVDGGGSTALNGRYITDVTGVVTNTIVWTDNFGGRATDSLSMALTTDRLGFLHCFYRYRVTSGEPTQNFSYWYAKIPAGSSWPELNNKSATGIELVRQVNSVNEIGQGGQICIAIDKDGGAHLCWGEDITGAFFTNVGYAQIWYASKAGASWVTETVINDTSKMKVNPSMSISLEGKIYMTWSRSNTVGGGIDHMIQLATRTGGLWSITDLLSDSGQTYICPRLLHHQVPVSGAAPGIAESGAAGVYINRATNGFTSWSDAGYYIFFTDDWAPDDGSGLSPEGPPEYAAETNFPSIVLQGEGTPIATYPLAPYFPTPASRRWVTERKESDGGWETTFPIAPGPRRIFPVHHDAMTSAEALVLQSFIETVKGPKSTFWFLPPGESASIVARLVEEVTPINKLASGVFQVELLVEEAFA